MTKAQEKAARVLAERRAAFGRKVSTLLGHVGGRVASAQLDEAFAADTLPEALAAQIAALEPVGRALHAGKAEAVKAAGERAQKTVDRVREALAEHGWDVNAAAPYPWSLHGYEADAAREKANLYGRLTKDDPAKGYQSRGMGNPPHFVVMDPKGVANYISWREREAATYYDAFIVKMVAKVGEVRDASIEGSHVWSFSILTVTLADGTIERWKTQEITNYSKLGLAFPQWPSRKLK
jgi:hypothetical protein